MSFSPGPMRDSSSRSSSKQPWMSPTKIRRPPVFDCVRSIKVAPCAPVLPHSRQPGAGPLREDPRAEVCGLLFELLLPRSGGFDQGWRRAAGAARQHVQIVMIAEGVRELVEHTGRTPSSPAAREAAVAGRDTSASSPLCATRAAPPRSAAFFIDRRPSRYVRRKPPAMVSNESSEAARTRSARPRPRADSTYVAISSSSGGCCAVLLERPLHVRANPARELELFQRLEHGIGVADGGQLAPGIAEPGVLDRELRAERPAHQTQQRRASP